VNVREAKALRNAPLGAMNLLLADMFALYVKTKNFHWARLRSPFSRLSSSP